MAIIKKDDYVFLVDIEKTKNYYKTHSLCSCTECRNYYVQVKKRFPRLNDFLNEFGVDISKPDEICSLEMNDYIDYFSVDYTVCGTINQIGKYEIEIYDGIPLTVTVTNGFVSPNEQTGQYFTISITKIQLPLVLEEKSTTV